MFDRYSAKLNRDLAVLAGGIVACAGLVGGIVAVVLDSLIHRHRCPR